MRYGDMQMGHHKGLTGQQQRWIWQICEGFHSGPRGSTGTYTIGSNGSSWICMVPGVNGCMYESATAHLVCITRLDTLGLLMLAVYGGGSQVTVFPMLLENRTSFISGVQVFKRLLVIVVAVLHFDRFF